MRHIIVGRTQREAQAFAMRFKEEHRGHEVRLMTAASVRLGGLRGYGGENTEVVLQPGVFVHPLELEALESHGVRVTTPTEED